MNLNILNTEVQLFIDTHLNDDIAKILLKGEKVQNVSAKEIVEQIESKLKCKTKLPTWFNTANIYYPNKLNIEQTSSELTANYKSQLISGNRIIDITGGFGVDSFYFSRRFKHCIYCEMNTNLSQIVNHNFQALKVQNIEVNSIDGLEFLRRSKEVFDCIYIDPSRRHKLKGKVFFLGDCLPNVPEHLDFLFSKTRQIMIKTSPLLDLSVGLRELSHVTNIYIVAVKNEVKELLWILTKNESKTTKINAVNLFSKNKKSCFEFDLNDEEYSKPNYSLPLTYLYEPNAALYKSGAFKLTATQLKVNKLGINSHLYTSESLTDFPGRRFRIDKVLPYNKKILKKELPNKANITARNFPETVNDIRKKFKIKDGGELYLFFTTNLSDEKVVLLCSKVE